MMPRLREAPAAAIQLAVEDAAALGDVSGVLRTRGSPAVAAASVEDALAADGAAVGFAPSAPISAARAAALAPLAARAAARGAPLVLLHAFPRALGSRADAAAAALAFLRAHGAVVCGDPDVWLEALVLMTRFGPPPGPRAAVIAPPGSWLAAAAVALENEAQHGGGRGAALTAETGRVGPTDVVLCDAAALTGDAADRVRHALIVPVVGRGELVSDAPALVGLRAALGAVLVAGRYAERCAAGLGPAGAVDHDALEPDRERFDRQLGKLDDRAGDHESKVLLAAYKVPITRQAVATTPSAATRIAKRAGFPVELKPWGADVPSELEGCPIERDLHTAADVRRAFAAVGRALSLPAGAPVVVRETPPAGRELRVRVVRLPELGWTVLVDVAGQPGTSAAPAPLRPVDADELALAVVASRSGDERPDRAALADLLVRVSHIAPATPRITSIDLARVIASSDDRALVVDARFELEPAS